ncbi:MAG TPA: CHAT domain-containing protein [Longimicrobium sp.]|nr:CHAT domain-containing protein [Longimicrobium sp.]
MEYHDLDIVLFPAGADGYVRLARCGTRHGERQETVPLDLDEVSRALRCLDDPGGDRVDASVQRDLGLTLYHGLLGDGMVGTQLDRCIGGAQSQDDAGVRVRLNLDQAPALAAIPWEFIYLPNDGRFLASSTHTPLVRYLGSGAPNLGLEVRLPVRVLVVLPENAARGDTPLDLAREKAVLQRALQPLVRADAADVRFLDRRVTRARLRAALRGGVPELGEEPFQVVCYAGHGHRDDTRACLFLDADGGGAEEVDDGWLAELFEGNADVKLVVLNACQGATVSALRPFAGIAPRLVKAGVPAVVAMQYPVADDEALCFAEAFYGSLFRGPSRGRVEMAVGEARRALRQDYPGSRGWGAPVLYMRSSGYLFTPTTGNPLAELPVTREAAETQRLAVREHEDNIRALQAAPPTAATGELLARERRELGNARTRLRLRAAAGAVVLGVAACATAAAALFPFGRLPPGVRTEAYAAWVEGLLPGDPLDGRILRVPMTQRTQELLARGFDAASVGAWRADHARVLDALSLGGARVVAFLQYFHAVTPQDTAFARAIRDARRRGTRVVVGLQEWDGALPRMAPALRAAGPDWGGMCIGRHETGETRVLPLVAFREGPGAAASAVPAFATAVVAAYHGDRLAGVETERSRVVFGNGARTRAMRYWRLESGRETQTSACPSLDARGTVASAIVTFSPARVFRSPRHLIAYEALLGPGAAAAAERARGGIAIVARENPDDVHDVFRLGWERRAGDEIQADAVNSVLRGATLRPLGGWGQLLTAVAAGAAGAAIALLSRARRRRGRALLLAGAAGLYLAVALVGVARFGVLFNAWSHLASLLLCFALVRLLRRRLAL